MKKVNLVCAVALSFMLITTASSTTPQPSSNNVPSAGHLSTNQTIAHQQNTREQRTVSPNVLIADPIIVCSSDGTVCCFYEPDGRPPICRYTALRAEGELASLRSSVLEKEIKGLLHPTVY